MAWHLQSLLVAFLEIFDKKVADYVVTEMS